MVSDGDKGRITIRVICEPHTGCGEIGNLPELKAGREAGENSQAGGSGGYMLQVSCRCKVVVEA